MPRNADGEPDEIDRHVGCRVREERLNRQFSQSGLAKELGVSFQQVQKYENGTNRISPSKLWRVARFFNMAPGDFFPPMDALSGTTPSQVDIMSTHDGQRVARALVRIKSAKGRVAVAIVAEALANGESDEAS